MAEVYAEWTKEHIVIPSTIKGIIDAQSITSVDRLKLIILGEPGVGKDWLACTGRPPILSYDFDDRQSSIAGKSGVYIKTLIDRDPLLPHAWQDLETDIGSIEYEIQKGTFPFKTIILSSLTFLVKAAKNQMVKDQAGLSRTIKIGNKQYKMTQGWDAINGIQAMIEGVLNRLFELKIDIIMTAHIRREKAADWQEDDPKFTGKFTIEPQYLKMLLPAFNDRWLLRNDYGKWEVLMQPDGEFNALTSLRIDGPVQPANIQEILKKHEQLSKRS